MSEEKQAAVRVELVVGFIEEFANRYGPIMIIQHLRTGSSRTAGSSLMGELSPGMQVLCAISDLCARERTIDRAVTVAGKKRVFLRPCPAVILCVVSRTVMGGTTSQGFQKLLTHATKAGAVMHLRALSKEDREKHLCALLNVQSVSLPLAALVSWNMAPPCTYWLPGPVSENCHPSEPPVSVKALCSFVRLPSGEQQATCLIIIMAVSLLLGVPKQKHALASEREAR